MLGFCQNGRERNITVHKANPHQAPQQRHVHLLQKFDRRPSEFLSTQNRHEANICDTSCRTRSTGISGFGHDVLSQRLLLI
jgi:hypothetical protein